MLTRREVVKKMQIAKKIMSLLKAYLHSSNTQRSSTVSLATRASHSLSWLSSSRYSRFLPRSLCRHFWECRNKQQTLLREAILKTPTKSVPINRQEALLQTETQSQRPIRPLTTSHKTLSSTPRPIVQVQTVTA